jgi:hypothetical protein
MGKGDLLTSPVLGRRGSDGLDEDLERCVCAGRVGAAVDRETTRVREIASVAQRIPI